MTNNRFTYAPYFKDHVYIRDNNTGIDIGMGGFNEPQAEFIVDLLNRLNDENKQLKDSNSHFKQWFREHGIYEIIVGDCKVILND